MATYRKLVVVSFVTVTFHREYRHHFGRTSRQLVEQELREKAFSPRIQAVLDYKDEFGVVSISARTDRGDVTFQIRSRDDIRLLSPTRALFRDADGNTYELPDLAALDPASRRYLEEYF